MALSLITTSTVSVTAGSGAVQAAGIDEGTPSPCVVSAAWHLSEADGCVLRFHWSIVNDPFTPTLDNIVWTSEDFTVDTADETKVGYLMPPCPVFLGARLMVTCVSGTPTGPLDFDLYKL